MARKGAVGAEEAFKKVVSRNKDRTEKSGKRVPSGIILPAMFDRPSFVAQSDWIEHIPFAFWLVAAQEPEIVVELGTQDGVSFFAFCQGAELLAGGTRCVGIATSVPLAGEKPGRSYKALREHAEADYPKSATILMDGPDAALARFADGSIDLLHIDGSHTSKMSLEELEAWLPKLSRRGLLLLHRTHIQHRRNAVVDLYEDLRETHSAFEFPHGKGLVLFSMGRNKIEPLRELFSAWRSDNERKPVQEMFARLGKGIADALALAEHDDADPERMEAADGFGMARESAELADERSVPRRQSDNAPAKFQALQTSQDNGFGKTMAPPAGLSEARTRLARAETAVREEAKKPARREREFSTLRPDLRTKGDADVSDRELVSDNDRDPEATRGKWLEAEHARRAEANRAVELQEETRRLAAALESANREHARTSDAFQVLQQTLERVQAELAETKAGQVETAKVLEQCRADLRVTEDRLREARQSVDEHDGDLATLRKAAADKDRDVAEARAALAQRDRELASAMSDLSKNNQLLAEREDAQHRMTAEAEIKAERDNAMLAELRQLEGDRQQVASKLQAEVRLRVQRDAAVAELQNELETSNAMAVERDALMEAMRADMERQAKVIERMETGADRHLQDLANRDALIEQSLEKISGLQGKVEEAARLAQTLQRAEAELATQREAFARLEQELERGSADREQLSAQRRTLQDRISFLESSLEQRRHEAEQTAAELLSAREEVRLAGVMRIERESLIASYKDHVAALTEERNVRRDEIAAMSAENRDLAAERDHAAEALQSAAERQADLEADIEDLEARSHALEEDLTTTRHDLAEARTQSSAIGDVATADAEWLKEEHAKLESRIQDYADKVVKLTRLIAEKDHEIRRGTDALAKLEQKMAKSAGPLSREADAARFAEERAEAVRQVAAQQLGDTVAALLEIKRFPFETARSRLRRQAAMLRRSGLFDERWYLDRYKDVAAAGVDPFRHYVEHGAKEGREPNPRLAAAKGEVLPKPNRPKA